MSSRCCNCSTDFSIDKRDLAYYAAISVPPPTWCSDCRMMRRMAHCNESELYSGSCSLCQKRVVSQYAPGAPWPVYCIDCWWSDRWQGQDYGREPDFSRSFLEQFYDLQLSVPHACVSGDIGNQNSDYTHHAGQGKNCYFIFHASICEDCYYGYGVKKAVSCIDVHNCFESELCYECVDVDKCYELKWCQDCFNCSSSSFLFDCIGCTNCFRCTGLRNKKYCFANEQLTRQEYEARIAAINLGSFTERCAQLKAFQDLCLRHPRKQLQNRMIEFSTGDYLIHANRSSECFDCRDVEQCRYCAQLQLGSRSCYDIYQFGLDMELCYEGAMVGRNAYNVHFGSLCIWQVSDLSYCIDCYSTSHGLLSFGIRAGKYTILNKQYDERTYRELRAKIIKKMTADGEFGEFFPVEHSQFAYNETTAFQWYPLAKEEVLRRGWRWRDELPGSRGRETLQELPDLLSDIPEAITDELLACESCGRNYKFIKQEMDFYRRHSIAPPRSCFGCRRKRRAALRNPRHIGNRRCDSCGQSTVSTHPAGSAYPVFCESCYLSSVE